MLVLPITVYEDQSYNNLRRGYLILIANLINEYLISGDSNDHIDMIMNIEKSCYEYAIETAEYELLTPDFEVEAFERLYRTIIVRITKNLDINSEVGDEHLAEGLLDGTIDPHTVSRLPNKDLSPMHNDKFFDELNTRLAQTVTLKTSTLYKCRQCGRKETTVRSCQMRSLDEASTLIIQCQFCHYKFFL